MFATELSSLLTDELQFVAILFAEYVVELFEISKISSLSVCLSS